MAHAGRHANCGTNAPLRTDHGRAALSRVRRRARPEIGVETSRQYDYKPAEIFVIEHQRVKYACKCCQGEVVIAPKPPQPIDRGLPGPGLGHPTDRR